MTQEEQGKNAVSIIKAHCSDCGGERNCFVHGHYQQNGESQDMNWWTDWRLLQCRGCEFVFVQRSFTDSESSVPIGYSKNGDLVYEQDCSNQYWPALAKRKKPEWMRYVGKNAVIEAELEEALNELYSALDNDLRMLSGIAIRTTFDIAATILGIEADQFNSKLDELVSKSFLRLIDKDNVQSIIDAGNASAHRGWRASVEDLDTMMEILEGFIYSAFVEPARRRLLDEKAARIKAGVPKREKKTRAQSKAAEPSASNGDAQSE